MPTNGGVLVAGNKKKMLRGRQVNEPRMHISFSIASGISTRTRRMDESFSAMPENLQKEGISRLDQQPYFANG